MKIISMVNGKGGVGKTGSTVNLATCLAKKENKVLVIDIDKQANATKYLGLYDPQKPSVADIIINNLSPEEVIRRTSIDNLNIIPASYEELDDAPDRIMLDLNRSRMTRLKTIKELDYDYILIDCPPDLGIVTMNALAISDYVLVPVKIDDFALEGFKKITDKMQIVRDEYNSKLKLLGAFITLDENTRVNNQIKPILKNQLKEKFFETTIRKTTKFTESTFLKMPVVEAYPEEKVTQDFLKLAEEVIRNIERE